jgi:hypothetical protein
MRLFRDLPANKVLVGMKGSGVRVAHSGVEFASSRVSICGLHEVSDDGRVGHCRFLFALCDLNICASDEKPSE